MAPQSAGGERERTTVLVSGGLRGGAGASRFTRSGSLLLPPGESVPSTADEWLEAIHLQFRAESDRAAAIVVAAMLDVALASLLRRRLLEAPSPYRSLLDGDRAPLSTFAAKIDAAYQLGLISKYMARDLHLVRKIRNDFAHNPLHLTFDSESVRNRVRALEQASDYNRRYPATRSAVGPTGSRWDFLGLTAWMLYALHRLLDDVAQVRSPTPEFGYIDWSALPPEVQRLLREAEATEQAPEADGP